MAACLRTRPLCVLVPYREDQFARQLGVLVLYRRTQLGRLHSALSFTDQAKGLRCEEIDPPGHLGGPLILLNFSQQVQLLWWPLGRLQIGGSLLDLFLTDLHPHHHHYLDKQCFPLPSSSHQWSMVQLPDPLPLSLLPLPPGSHVWGALCWPKHRTSKLDGINFITYWSLTDHLMRA